MWVVNRCPEAALEEKLCADGYGDLLPGGRTDRCVRSSDVCNAGWKGEIIFLWVLVGESENY